MHDHFSKTFDKLKPRYVFKSSAKIDTTSKIEVSGARCNNEINEFLRENLAFQQIKKP